jgi:hypothetical protein
MGAINFTVVFNILLKAILIKVYLADESYLWSSLYPGQLKLLVKVFLSG